MDYKTLFSRFFEPPAGWPERGPLLKSSLNSYRALWLCHQRLIPKYRMYVEQAKGERQVYHIASVAQIRELLSAIELDLERRNL